MKLEDASQKLQGNVNSLHYHKIPNIPQILYTSKYHQNSEKKVLLQSYWVGIERYFNPSVLLQMEK